MQLDEAIAAYLASLEAEGRSGRTVAAYGRDLATLRAELGSVEVGTVRPPQLLAWASSARVALKVDGAPKNQSSVNRARSAVRGLFWFLTAGWIIDRDPSLVLRVKSTQPPPPSVLGQLDEAKLLQVMTQDPSWEAHRDALMLRTLLDTGIRVSGLVDLDRSDIDVERGRLLIHAKGGHRQEVKIDPALATDLLAHAGDDGVFATRQGRRLSVRQVQTRLAEWSERAGMADRLHPHLLRHTFGTRRYAETKDLRRVQVALGHRSILTTQRYVGVEAA